MKVKTLRFKDTKEFVHIIEGGLITTGGIPDVLPLTASIDTLKEYFNTFNPEEEVNYDNLEVIEMDCIESGVVGADIRNKLTPFKNLIAMVKDYDGVLDHITKERRDELIKVQLKKCEESLLYIAQIL